MLHTRKRCQRWYDESEQQRSVMHGVLTAELYACKQVHYLESITACQSAATANRRALQRYRHTYTPALTAS